MIFPDNFEMLKSEFKRTKEENCKLFDNLATICSKIESDLQETKGKQETNHEDNKRNINKTSDHIMENVNEFLGEIKHLMKEKEIKSMQSIDENCEEIRQIKFRLGKHDMQHAQCHDSALKARALFDIESENTAKEFKQLMEEQHNNQCVHQTLKDQFATFRNDSNNQNNIVQNKIEVIWPSTK